MVETVTITRELIGRIRAFINQFALNCYSCMRRVEIGCIGCENLRAKVLVAEIDNIKENVEARYYINNPVEARFARAVKAIEQAGRPLKAREIDMSDVSSNLKKWTLGRMCELNILKRVKEPHGQWLFSIKNGINKQNNNNNII